MKGKRTSQGLYQEMLNLFYMGLFPKGTRFMTYVEFQQTFHVSKSTAARTYKLLSQGGFIETCGVNGTEVTFDAQNPKHLACMQYRAPAADVQDFNTHVAPVMVLSTLLRVGLEHSSPQQIDSYILEIQTIADQIRRNVGSPDMLEQLLNTIMHAVDNQYIHSVFEHFITQYLYYNRYVLAAHMPCFSMRTDMLRFCERFEEVLLHGNYDELVSAVRHFFDEACRTPGVLMLNKLEGGQGSFKEQALYVKLLQKLFTTIKSGHLKPGASLPTSQQLRSASGVGDKTVRRAYQELVDIGIVTRKKRIGTQLCDLEKSETMRIWMEYMAGTQRKQLHDAVEAFLLLCADAYRWMVPPLEEAVEQMRAEFRRQQDAYQRYEAPFMVAEVVMTPVMHAHPYGIIQKYYGDLCSVLIHFRVLHFIRPWELGQKEQQVEELLQKAIGYAERAEYAAFAQEAMHALELNGQFLMDAFDRM